MTTALIERCKAAAADLAAVASARRNVHQRAAVQKRAEEWDEHCGKLDAARARAALVNLDPNCITDYAARQVQMRELAQQAAQRLAEEADTAVLTADALWTRLLQSAAATTNALDDAVKAAWRRTVDAEGAVPLPADLRARLPQTPTNNEAMAAYGRHHLAYARLSTQPMPRSADDLVGLHQAAAACRAELAKLQFDVPPDVEAFFRAVHGNTATLSSLTPVVMQWLRENGQLDRYLVRSAFQ